MVTVVLVMVLVNRPGLVPISVLQTVTQIAREGDIPLDVLVQLRMPRTEDCLLMRVELTRERSVAFTAGAELKPSSEGRKLEEFLINMEVEVTGPTILHPF